MEEHQIDFDVLQSLIDARVSGAEELLERIRNKLDEDLYVETMNTDEISQRIYSAADRASEITSQPEMKKLGITQIDGQRIFSVPKPIYDNEDIHELIFMISMILDCVVVTYNVENYAVDTMDKDHRLFCLGLISIFTETEYVRIKPKSRQFELGRTAGIAEFLRQTAIVLSDEEVIPFSLLKKNQEFYGNDKTDTIDRTDIPKGVHIRCFFREILGEDYGKSFYRVFCLALKEFEFFNQINEEVRNKYIKAMYGDVIALVRVHWTPRMVRKGRREVQEGWIKPKKPSPSPLLTPGENKFIQDFIKPLFNNLGLTQENVGIELVNYGYKSVKTYVGTIMNQRKDIRERYANLTTKRLQQIRANEELDRNFKKKDVTQEHVMRLLRERQNPIRKFREEVLSLLPKVIPIEEHLREVFSDKGVKFSERTEVTRILDHLTYEFYSTELDTINIGNQPALPEHAEDFSKQVKLVSQRLTKFTNRISSVNNWFCGGRRRVTEKSVFIQIDTILNARDDYHFINESITDDVIETNVRYRANSPLIYDPNYTVNELCRQELISASYLVIKLVKERFQDIDISALEEQPGQAYSLA